MKVAAFFHLNLAYSSIDAERWPDLLRHCYTPLLDLAEVLPIGLEINGWSLEQLQNLAPAWVDRLRDSCARGRVGILGSGYVQLIGPLVPATAQAANFHWGNQVVQQLLHQQPRIALVHEMAYAEGLNRLYHQAGFHTLILEEENLLASLGWPVRPARIGHPAMNLLLASSTLMQKTQRFVQGDLSQSELLSALQAKEKEEGIHFLYSGDLEIFGFRPNRYRNEHRAPASSDWPMLGGLFEEVASMHEWQHPGEWRHSEEDKGRAARLLWAQDCAIVKKQRKYNLSRWAVTGRNDLLLNTYAHNLTRLAATTPPSSRRWLPLVKTWASDLRTHITPKRMQTMERHLRVFRRRCPSLPTLMGLPLVEWRDQEGVCLRHDAYHLCIETPTLRATLLLRRGGCFHSLCFKSHGQPSLHSPGQGSFRALELTADFYSGLALLDSTQEPMRWTNLEPIQPRFLLSRDQLLLQWSLPAPKGVFRQQLGFSLQQEECQVVYDLSGMDQHLHILRLGGFCLSPALVPAAQLRLSFADALGHTHNYRVRSMDQSLPVSLRVSCAGGIPAQGQLSLHGRQRGLRFSWDPHHNAALPLLLHRPDGKSHLTRLFWSNGELDETRTAHGAPPPLALTITPF
jgi:hypothetical protein